MITAHHVKQLGGFLSLLLAVTLQQCGYSETLSTSGVEPRLLSLALYPSDVTLRGADATQAFVVLGKYSDGVQRDVMSESRLSLSHPELAQVDDSGRVLALADGEAVLTARFGDLETRAELRVEDIEKTRPFDFQRDIGGILTRHGCNATECHGGVKGQNGFKLSLSAYYPAEDHRWIVKGGGFQVLIDEAEGEEIPRIDRKDPDKSLLLLKSTNEDHEGGELFTRDSEEYKTILEWIQRGATLEQSPDEESRVTGLEIFPSLVVLDEAASHQLIVSATLTGGGREDFTDTVSYESINEEVATVTSDGRLHAVGTGETAIVIRAAGHTTSRRVAVVAAARRTLSELDAQLGSDRHIPARNFIDEYVFAKLNQLGIIPSAHSNDSEFLRRVCLDVTGTLPPPERTLQFLEDSSADKRDRVIEILLDSPEYVDYWTFRFADLFRVRGGSAEPYYDWVRECIAGNKPYDQIARERIAAEGFDRPSRFYTLEINIQPLERIVAEDMRVFMGRRLDCAQCHNHPFEPWSQDQFWGLAAFYGRLTTTDYIGPDRQCVVDDPNGQEIDIGVNGAETLQFRKVVHPRTKAVIDATFLDGRAISPDARDNPRQTLADWITSYPYFAEAIVNRMWSYFFGRGIVHPVDNFRSTNVPTHPELLEALAEDFIQHDHDLKHLIRRIVRSRTYQLSGVPNDSNRKDTLNYARALPRPLDAEVLLDAISSAAGVTMNFRRDELDILSQGIAKAPRGTRAIQLKVPMQFLSRFLEVYGRPFRDAVPERHSGPNLTQALHILAGSTYTTGLSQDGSRVDQMIKLGTSDDTIIEHVYLASVSRYPTSREQEALKELLPDGSATPEGRRKSFGNLLWALVASREFAYNH